MKQLHIVHIVESFGSGIIEFILQLTIGMPHYKHSIIYALREIPFDDIKCRFPNYVNFCEWKHVQRSISIKSDLKAYLELRSKLRSLGSYDVVHLHSSKAGFLGRLALIRKKVQVIYTPNGVSFAVKNASCIKKIYFVFLEYIANLMSGQVVGVSKSEAQLFTKIGIPAICINNGISSIAPPDRSKSINENSIIIINVGRISIQKNPELFNSIASHFLENTKIKFVWVGDGELKSKLTSPNIQVTGWQSKAEVRSILSKSSIFLSTSQWEGLPFAGIEAMASELPLLISNCVGNVDLVIEGVNGFIFNSEPDAVKILQQYLNDISMVRTHGSQSYKIFRECFTSEIMVAKYNQLYMKMGN